VNNYNPVSLRVTTASVQKIASKIAKDIMAAGYYGWNNPNNKLQNFIDLLLELADALEKNDIKRIKKILENKVGNYGKTILLTKELYDRLMNIIDAIEDALNEHKDDFDGKSFANDIKRLANDIERIYF
jgi:molecular chaperone GrpE (heat shock protein)